MITIGEKLRKAREAQGRTLDDIAAATRINRKFLDDLERGITPPVPMTYVRAFIKSYAGIVGLDHQELLKELEPPPPAPPAPVQRSMFEDAAPPPVAPAPRREETPRPEPAKGPQPIVLVVLSALVVVGLVVIILALRQEHSTAPPQEISFSDVVKEQEARLRPASTDSTAAAAVPAKPPRPDSLSLEGVARDSVWVRVVIDGATTSEYTLPPSYRIRWKAKKSFLLSLGNGAGMIFSLNGRDLGTLGASRKPVKNVPVSWETYDKFRPKSVQKE